MPPCEVPLHGAQRQGEKRILLKQIRMGSGAGKSYFILILYVHQKQIIQGVTLRKSFIVAGKLMGAAPFRQGFPHTIMAITS